jgi:hypothetical protein
VEVVWGGTAVSAVAFSISPCTLQWCKLIHLNQACPSIPHSQRWFGDGTCKGIAEYATAETAVPPKKASLFRGRMQGDRL